MLRIRTPLILGQMSQMMMRPSAQIVRRYGFRPTSCARPTAATEAPRADRRGGREGPQAVPRARHHHAAHRRLWKAVGLWRGRRRRSDRSRLTPRPIRGRRVRHSDPPSGGRRAPVAAQRGKDTHRLARSCSRCSGSPTRRSRSRRAPRLHGFPRPPSVGNAEPDRGPRVRAAALGVCRRHLGHEALGAAARLRLRGLRDREPDRVRVGQLPDVPPLLGMLVTPRSRSACRAGRRTCCTCAATSSRSGACGCASSWIHRRISCSTGFAACAARWYASLREPGLTSGFPLTAERYLALAQQGVFGPTIASSCSRGVIVAMPPHETRHSAGVRRAIRALSRAVGERAVIQVQLSLEAGAASVPEPTSPILPGTIEDYDHRHPRSALLVVERSRIRRFPRTG